MLQSGSLEGCTQGSSSPDQMLLRAYTCALKNKSNQGWSTCYQVAEDQVLLQAYTCVLQNDKTQHFTQGSTVTKVWPTTCCCGHTHVCCRTHQRRVARGSRFTRFGRPSSAGSIHMCVAEQTDSGLHPKGRRVHRFDRPIVALSAHMCVAEYVNSRLHPWVKGYKELAGHVLLRGFARPTAAASIHMCVAKQIKSGLHPRVEMLQGFGRPAPAGTHTRAAER